MGGKRRFVRCSMMLREVVSQVFCNFGANSGCKCCIAIPRYMQRKLDNSVELIIAILISGQLRSLDKMLRAFGEGGAAKKRPSSTIAGSQPRADGAKFASVGGGAPSYNPFLECSAGTRVIYSNSTLGRDGSTRMALFPAVVVKSARERVDGDHYLIKLAADGQRWWERTCNVYDIVVPESAAANADGSGPRSVPPMCDGVHRSHFVETANDEFDRRREWTGTT